MVVVVVVVVVDCVGKSPLEGRENDIKEEEKKKKEGNMESQRESSSFLNGIGIFLCIGE